MSNIACFKCDEPMRSWRQLKHHIDTAHPGPVAGDPCPYCRRSYRSSRGLQTHVIQCHANELSPQKEQGHALVPKAPSVVQLKKQSKLAPIPRKQIRPEFGFTTARKVRSALVANTAFDSPANRGGGGHRRKRRSSTSSGASSVQSPMTNSRRRKLEKEKRHMAKIAKKHEKIAKRAAVEDLSAEHQREVRQMVRKLKLDELKKTDKKDVTVTPMSKVVNVEYDYQSDDNDGEDSDASSTDSEILQKTIQKELDRRASLKGKQSHLPLKKRVAIFAGPKPNFDSIKHQHREAKVRVRRQISLSSSESDTSENDSDNDGDDGLARFSDDDDDDDLVPKAGANLLEPIPPMHKHRQFLSTKEEVLPPPPNLENCRNLIGYKTNLTPVNSFFYCLQTFISSKFLKNQPKLTPQRNIVNATDQLYFSVSRQCPKLRRSQPLASSKRFHISLVPIIAESLDLCITVFCYAQETGNEVLSLYENVMASMRAPKDEQVYLFLRRDTNTFALIKDNMLFLSCFRCPECKVVFNNRHNLRRHTIVPDRCPAKKFYALNPGATYEDYEAADPMDYLGSVSYPGTRVRAKQLLSDKLASVGIEIDPRTDFMPYFGCLDIESYLGSGEHKLDASDNIDGVLCQTIPGMRSLVQNTVETHRPASVAVVTTLPDEWCVPYVFVSLDGTGCFIRSMVQYLTKCSKYAFHLLRQEFSEIYELLDKFIQKAERRGKIGWAKRIRNVKKELESHQRRLPIFAFNASYDVIVLLRGGLAVYLTETDGGEVPTFLRNQNKIIHLSSKSLMIMDVYNFLGSRTSLANFLYTYAENVSGAVNMSKSYYPYEKMSDHRALKTKLESLKYDDFWSSLKQVNVLNDDYLKLQHYVKSCGLTESAALKLLKRRTKPVPGQVLFVQLQVFWRLNGMKMLLDWLCFYNLADTVPLALGIGQLKMKMESIIGVPMLQYLTLSQLAYNWSLRIMAEVVDEDQVFLVAPGEKLAKVLRQNMAGGISTITDRLAVAGFSKIRPHIYGDKSKLVQCVRSWDANSLYGSISYEQLEVTGNYSTRIKENDFLQTDLNQRNLMSLGWLRWMEAYVLQKRVQTITSNTGEHRLFVNGSVLQVDGWIDEGTNDQGERWGTVLEFLGSEVHSDPQLLTEDQYNSDTNPITKRPHCVEYAHTVKRLQMLREHKSVKQVICMWSADWKQQLRTDPVKQGFVHYWLESIAPPQIKRRFNWETALRYVLEEQIYGIIEADLEVPAHRLPDLAPVFGPLIVHRDLSRSNVCKLEADYCIRKGKLTKPVRTLCIEYSAQRMVLTSNLFRYLIDVLGLVCTDIHTIYSYRVQKGSKPFKPFVEYCHKIRENARQNDLPIEQAIAKTLPNAMYGQSIMRVTGRSTTKFIDGSEYELYSHKPQFQSVYAAGIPEESPWALLELQQRKLHSVEKQPLNYGFFVLNTSKLSLLRFAFSILAKYLEPSSWQPLAIDTDSITCSLSEATIDECVKSELKEEFLARKNQIFVNPDIPSSYHQPGLWKQESHAFLYLGLGPKSWLLVPCDPGEKKLASKGINKAVYNKSVLSVGNVLRCIFERQDTIDSGINRGIRCSLKAHEMQTYAQPRHCFNKMCLKMGYFEQCNGLCSRPRTIDESHPCFKEIYPCGDYECGVTYESVVAHVNKLVEKYPHLADEL